MADPTCEDRIDKAMAGRLEDLRTYLAATSEWPEGPAVTKFAEMIGEKEDELTEDQLHSWIDEYPLAVSMRRVMRVEFSWGGPQDYVDLNFPDGEWLPDSGTYRFLDWFDGARRELEGEDLDTFSDAFGNLLELVDGDQ